MVRFMPCVALAAGALIAIPLAVNAQSYRCVGSDGKKYYGQTIPNQCIGQPVEQLDKHGVVIRRIENKTPEDKAAKKAEEKRKSEEAAIKKEEDRIVYIKSGVGVSYGEVVNVINEVRGLGVDKIGLVADKKKKAGSTAPAA